MEGNSFSMICVALTPTGDTCRRLASTRFMLFPVCENHHKHCNAWRSKTSKSNSLTDHQQRILGALSHIEWLTSLDIANAINVHPGRVPSTLGVLRRSGL